MSTELAEPILDRPERVTPERLTAILRDAGLIAEARVTGFTSEPIGVGLMGDTYRFTLAYDRTEAGAPASVAGKFATANPEIRQAAAVLYLIEYSFYSGIASDVRVRRPGCYYAELDQQSWESGLLLEDVGPARSADQIEGCSRADAELAMYQAAALHSSHLGRSELGQVEWMNIRYQSYPEVFGQFDSYVATFREQFSHLIEPEFFTLAEKLGKVGTAISAPPKRGGLIHGDYRLDNMLFDAKGGEVPLVILDWQSIGYGNPGLDLAYFLSNSYPLDRRAGEEQDLLRLYHDHLRGFGVTDYGWDELWHDYRRSAWLGIGTAIHASAFSKRTERGDQMFARMMRGSAIQMLEHGTLDLA